MRIESRYSTILLYLLPLLFLACAPPTKPVVSEPSFKIKYRVFQIESEEEKSEAEIATGDKTEISAPGVEADTEVKANPDEETESTMSELSTAEKEGAEDTGFKEEVPKADEEKATENSDKPPSPPIELPKPGEIGYYRLTGIITRPDGELLALVEELTGKGYIVSKGSFVGMSEIHVKEIYIDRVVLQLIDAEKGLAEAELPLEQRPIASSTENEETASETDENQPDTTEDESETPKPNISFSAGSSAIPLSVHPGF